jgi:hypothetical protein
MLKCDVVSRSEIQDIAGHKVWPDLVMVNPLHDFIRDKHENNIHLLDHFRNIQDPEAILVGLIEGVVSGSSYEYIFYAGVFHVEGLGPALVTITDDPYSFIL